MKTPIFVLSLLAGLLGTLPAHAHRSSDSYLKLTATPRSLEGHWDIALRDLDYALELDDGDGALSWGELRGREADVRAYAASSLEVDSGSAPCAVSLGAVGISELSDGSYARFPVSIRCPGELHTVRFQYGLMAELDPQHRGILRIADADRSHDAILAKSLPAATFVVQTAGAERPNGGFATRVGEGFMHILSGADHVLFLIALLLGTVLVRHVGDARGKQSVRVILTDLTQIVTAFTLAHSLTLALGALGLVSVSSRVIEPAIAASVALAALANLYPIFGRDVWAVPFALGLLHGFGFSSALTDAGLSRGALGVALLGFNIGVELGQLCVLALFVPMAMAVRSHALPRKLLLYGGSLATLALSAAWFIDRLEIG